MYIAGMGPHGTLRLLPLRQSRRWAAALVLGLSAVLGGSQELAAQTLTLQATADAAIKHGSPSQNFGAQKTLVLKEGGGRVLVRFDPAAIAAAVGGGSLASAQLQLYIGANAANWGPTGRTVDAYRVDADWVERAATWSCADDTDLTNAVPDCATPWNGGTIEDDASDTVVLTNASAGWIQFDVTADVQAFLAGTENDGWLIQKTDEGQAGRVDLVSREGAAGQGPRLVLTSESATVDTVPPSLAITAPAQPVVVNVASLPIAVAYHDGGSGVDTSTLQILLDGQDLTAACTAGAQSATCTPPPLAAGTHGIIARLRDQAGNSATATMSFQLFIGPSVNTLTFPVAADTYLTAHAPDREHGRAAILRVAKSGPSRSLAQFDPAPLAAALAGNQLLSAQLELTIAANGNNWGASGRTVGAYRLTTGWSESAATWDCPADSNLDNAAPDCVAPWNGGAFVASPTATALLTRHLAGEEGGDE
ncbi:MAG TPA: DNRLRE domain-containing protein [Thermoanaerobaculia bacterium]|nr:DNRLRE domain-containing protein [Thermoanaerobaculia bacterium]